MTRAPVPTTTLLDALPTKAVRGAMPASVTGLAYDSRKVEPGDLFVAVTGFRQDGRRYVGEALGRGATAVVLEGDDLLTGTDTGRVLVPSTREALARLADAYFGHPSRALTVVGITGTNGKTTTSFLVDALLRRKGMKTGVIGTIEYRIGDETRSAGQTTPEAVDLQSMLAEMIERAVTGVAMEVSSHALTLHRVDGVEFDVAVFTNLTQDHLDFHGALEAYREAKARLFALLAAGRKPRRTAVINADDPAGLSMVSGLDLSTLTFGIASGADVTPRRFESAIDGIRMDVQTPRGALPALCPHCHVPISSPTAGPGPASCEGPQS